MLEGGVAIVVVVNTALAHFLYRVECITVILVRSSLSVVCGILLSIYCIHVSSAFFFIHFASS